MAVCMWQSIMPGIRVASPASTMSVPSGTVTSVVLPTSRIRSSPTRTTASWITLPVSTSIS